MLKTLPHKGPRRRGLEKRSTRRSAGDPKKCEVQPPRIFVEVASTGWNSTRHTPAKIRVRRGCYRYLVWRDGLLKCEFYLGKIKNLTRQNPRGAAPGADRAGDVRPGRVGVQK